MKNLNFKRLLILIAFAGMVLFTVLNFDRIMSLGGTVFGICMPFFIGIILAFVLNMIMVPVERLLTGQVVKVIKIKKSLAKGIAIIFSYIVLIALIVALLAFVIPELVSSISTFVGNMSTYVDELEDFAAHISKKYNIDAIDFNAIIEEFNDIIKNLANYILTYLGNMVPQVISLMSNIVSVAFNLIMSIVVSANILAYKEKLISQISRTIKCLLPKWHGPLAKLAKVSTVTFHDYIFGQCLEAVILGVLCYIGMVIFRFDYALLISTVIAATALIPVAGAYIGGGVAFVLLAFISPVKALLFLLYLVLLQQFETNLIYPKVVGSSLELPGIWVIFAVTLGGGALGVPGILFAVPVMSIIYKLLREKVVNSEKAEKRGTDNRRNEGINSILKNLQDEEENVENISNNNGNNATETSNETKNTTINTSGKYSKRNNNRRKKK